MKKILFVALTGIVLASCGPTSLTKSRSQAFVDLLNNNFAFDAQSTFYVAKSENESYTSGFVVVYSDDTGYVAYDLGNYVKGQSWTTYVNNYEYQPVSIYDTFNDGYETFYYGFARYWDGTPVGEFVFEEVGEKHKDLAKVMAAKEKYVEAKIAKGMAKEYGLSQEGSEKIAKIYTKLNKAASKGALTRAQDQVFAKEFFHKDLASIEKMYKDSIQGDSQAYDDFISQVSSEYGFKSPEHFNQVAQDLLK